MNRREILGVLVGAALPVKTATDVKAYERLLRHGLMSPTKARAALGLDPLAVCKLFDVDDRVSRVACAGPGFVAQSKQDTERIVQ